MVLCAAAVVQAAFITWEDHVLAYGAVDQTAWVSQDGVLVAAINASNSANASVSYAGIDWANTDAAEAAADRRRRDGLRSLRKALSGPDPAVIAECKKASPSAGVLRADFDPAGLAARYRAGGAAAISVVTERDFFQGRPEWLSVVRAAVDLPVLRKDFIVDEHQLREAALLGADAVLLIQRILPGDRLAALIDAARGLGLETLVEVFVAEGRAGTIASGADAIGVNARDLATFVTRLDVVEEMVSRLPADRVRVAESTLSLAREQLRQARDRFERLAGQFRTELDAGNLTGAQTVLDKMKQFDVPEMQRTARGYDAIEGRAIHHQVLLDRKSVRPPRFDPDLVPVAVLAHVELAHGGALPRSMRPAVDHHSARATDPLPTIAVEDDWILTLFLEVFVDHVQHLEEGHVGAHVF